MQNRLVSGFLVCAILVVGFVIKTTLRRHRRNAKAAAQGCLPPPAVRSTNWLGNSVLRESIKATRQGRGPQYIVGKMNSVAPECHTVKVPILDYELIVTRDPENVRLLLGGPDFDISSTRQNSFMPLLGKGIFTNRGKPWQHSRALLRPLFSKEIIGDIVREEQHLRALMKRIPVTKSTGWTDKVDLGPLFFKFTLDTATDFIFGRSTHSQRGGEGEDISRHWDSAKEFTWRRGELAKFYWLMNSAEFRRDCKAVHKFAESIITERLANPPDPESKKRVRFNLLNELTKTTQDPDALRNELLHVLVAGRDTSGSLMGWVFYMLARHPRVFQRLRCSVLEHFGNQQPDFRTLSQIEYLRWVINETLRVVPVIPLNERVALRDTVLPRGGGPDGNAKVFVATGTQVLIPIYALHHREDIWGPNVEEWMPERWESYRPGWEFIPFGGGFRKCPGQQFAWMEVNYVVARFCQRYDRIENMGEGDGQVRMHVSIENRSGTGVQVRLHEAQTWYR